MAEVKSTLELVMERTRHLTMSEEDKREQAAAEFHSAVKRLIQKYLDGQINLDSFRDELDRLQGSHSAMATAATEIAGRIDPFVDNGLLLDLIKYGLGEDTSRIEAALQNFRETVDREDCRASERIKAELLERGISGSAVIPNIEADTDRTNKLDAAHKDFRQKLTGAFRSSGVSFLR